MITEPVAGTRRRSSSARAAVNRYPWRASRTERSIMGSPGSARAGRASAPGRVRRGWSSWAHWYPLVGGRTGRVWGEASGSWPGSFRQTRGSGLDDEGTMGVNIYSTSSEDIDDEAPVIADLFATQGALAVGRLRQLNKSK